MNKTLNTIIVCCIISLLFSSWIVELNAYGESDVAIPRNKNEYVALFSADLRDLNARLAEFEKIIMTPNEEDIYAKRVAIYDEMVRILKKKRNLFNSYRGHLERLYAQEKQADLRIWDTASLEKIHKYIVRIESKVDYISQQIEAVEARKKIIINSFNAEDKAILSTKELDKKKANILSVLFDVIAEKNKMVKLGKSPNEISELNRKIEFLKTNYVETCVARGETEPQISKELNNYIDESNEFFKEKYDGLSLSRGFSHQKIDQLIKKGVDHRMVNNKESLTNSIYQKDNLKKDKRMKARIYEHIKPAKIIEKNSEEG